MRNFFVLFLLFYFSFALSSCQNQKNLSSIKKRTYIVQVIPKYSNIQLLFDNSIPLKNGLKEISLPNWMGCIDYSSKGPLGNCTSKHLNEYFNTNLQIPSEALSNSVEGKAAFKFKLDKEGVAKDIEIIKEPGGGIGSEIHRLVETFPKWESAQINNQFDVATIIEMEVNFDIVLR